MPDTWSRWTPVTPAPARSAPHSEHAPGAHAIVASGPATCCSVEDRAPGCLPGGRWPRSRRERSRGLFAYGRSDDGGRDESGESFPSRSSSSATRAASASTCAAQHRDLSVPRRQQLVLGLDDLAQPRVRGAQRGDRIICSRRHIGHNPHQTTASAP
jgi:hypothetical protein